MKASRIITIIILSTTALAVLVLGQTPESELPPKEVLKIKEENGEKFLFTWNVWNGIAYTEILEPKRTDIDGQTLLDLIYRKDEIPGLYTIHNPLTGTHTAISVRNDWAYIIRTYRSKEKVDVPSVHNALHAVRIELRVYSDFKGAEKWANEWSRGPRWARSPSEPTEPVYKENRGLPSGFSLGERYWVMDNLPQTYTIGFLMERVVTQIWWFSHAEADSVFTEALAWGIEYRIQQHPKLLGMAKQPMKVLVANQPVAQGKAVSLAGVTVAPISALEPAQVALKTERTKTEWRATATRNGRWVKVKAFSWEMETPQGKVKLERPVFPHKGELIVPIRQVAEALGLKVEQKGQTIALRP